MPRAEVLAQVCQDGMDVAEDTRFEDLADDVELGQEEGPQGLGAEQALCGGEFGDLGRLGGVQPDRLLHQCVLAALQRQPGAGEMGGVLGGDVHDVDVLGVDQVLVRAVGAGYAMAVREVLGAGRVAGGDGREPLAGVALDGVHEALRDPAGAEDTPAQGGGVHRVGGAGEGQGGHRSDLQGRGGGEPDIGQTSGTWTGTVRPPSFMDAMTASATAEATSPSYAVASGVGWLAVTASVHAWSSRR